jgi:serine/threonine protein kinase/formylglycine-generating enzyme required for sulfatase activity
MNDPNPTVDEPGWDSGPPVPAVPAPAHIGRYRIERVLGRGGFGRVYLAHDEQLQRLVAIKVPHPERVERPEDAAAYLTEARTVANLDHPNIVPVHDVGSTPEFPCFVVSKYIDGTDLATRLRQSRLSLHEAVELVATVAEALHHAHKQGLVHRDIKPDNILLNRSGKPFVADFGLALREQDVGQGPRYAGTPAYMSPEQARGEGHRVDGRSDIFSLGAVFYELLTGRRLFKGESHSELLEQITSGEPRPPRQIDDTIPRELDRICLKALAKRASERYSAARDMADDLWHFLNSASVEEKATLTGRGKHEPEVTTPVPTPATPPVNGSQPVKIVPKGLRSFDAADADFFLELLPGARDRDGLPDSIRFWKTRGEATDADSTFAVGLIYGPSGCGKSSLAKAGLLPRLVKSVTAVYIEATGEETEARLLRGLRRQLPDLPGNLSLGESLAGLRRGRHQESGQKVLLVLDQFEQWLHARRNEENTELVQALRQCDGGRVQALVLVRDDFWLAVSRFMQALEIRVVEGENSRLVDLFDTRHARKVLIAFGRAFGALSEKELTREQDAFLDQAVAGLAQDGKVISVRLALFAEMVKGKPWTPATLREVGGTEGVGETFLDETFTASTAPPQHRLHQKAAQAVLKALLPQAGTDIKGHMRSQQELLEASGYASRPRDFDDLVRILDSELRLLTPTDPEGKEDADPSTRSAGVKYYQLTHDYLVPSLRDWLTRKQRETMRGRAELRLAERAALWSSKPETRHLPAWWEWANIRLLTRRRDWTPPQRRMMSRAARWHGLRLGALLLLLAGFTWGAWAILGSLRAAALVRVLAAAETADVPKLVADIGPYRRWADPLLRQVGGDDGSKERLHAALALVDVDAAQADYLGGRLLHAGPAELPVIRDALRDHAAVRQRLGEVLCDAKADPEQRFRAACALAGFTPSEGEPDPWPAVAPFVANRLVGAVQQNPAAYPAWVGMLQPVRDRLLGPLTEVFRNKYRPEDARLASSILADYAADRPELLADLAMDADEKQFAVLWPRLEARREGASARLDAELLKTADAEDAKEQLARRQANAAVALLKLNQPAKVWPLLAHRPDPRVRSYLIHRLGPLAAHPAALVKRLAEEPDVTIRRALLLSLGPEEFARDAWTPEGKKALVQQVQELFRTVADPGLHAATEWLLRQWGEEAWLAQANEQWAKDKQGREKRLDGIRQELLREKDRARPQWYVTGQGQTMVVIPGPVEFQMGSPPTEADWRTDELLHTRRIGRTFALAATSVTREQFLRFLPKFGHDQMKRYPEPTCPIGGMVWYESAAYCNWLSKQEDIPEDQWCYETNAAGQVLKLKENYLSLTGYRLPTEAECEYACRAGAVTSRSYGATEELLPKYGWYFKNSAERTWPVGSKKPNDLGLFDMHGNVFTWCQEMYKDYEREKEGEYIEDKEDVVNIDSTKSRVLRGGSFYLQASIVRCGYRSRDLPADRDSNVGFRPARTFR